ncbi:MAG: hypothetical protein ACREKS_00625 [Candidatus Rokuibacteriota bacterium]
MANGKFRLLETFRTTFAGTVYKHRDSSLGNKIGRQLFEDVLLHGVSSLYREHVAQGSGVVNSGGRIHTPRTIRRNDSVFGRPPAGAALQPPAPGFVVPEGPVAEPRIGCEVKIIAKSQQKQIDRVISDLENFALRMRSLSNNTINVAVVGVNQESDYVGHEGERAFKHRLRNQEPLTTMARLREQLLGRYDELLVLPFKATNQTPYPFAWTNAPLVELDYGAALTRIGDLYQRRFR